MLNKIILTSSIAITTIFGGQVANARTHIEMVGSSTVFPFATVVAETFGKKTGLVTPKIESTGSGGGMKLFCAGDGINTPDITGSSRRIKIKEYQKCQKNGVTNITEVLLGFDGIAIANAKNGPDFHLTLRDLYLALAAQVPAGATGRKENKEELITNPFTHWNQVNFKLPNVKIRVIGPPPTSGTRDALQELALEGGCKTYKFIQELKKQDKKRMQKLCRTVREDGYFIEAGENDNLIISKLVNDKNTLGIFGFSFLDQNTDKVKGSLIGGSNITFENIASGKYPISRPLYFYVKNSHRIKVKGMNDFIAEFVKEDTFGEEGYLVDKGLIPSSMAKREQFRKAALQAIKLSL